MLSSDLKDELEGTTIYRLASPAEDQATSPANPAGVSICDRPFSGTDSVPWIGDELGQLARHCFVWYGTNTATLPIRAEDTSTYDNRLNGQSDGGANMPSRTCRERYEDVDPACVRKEYSTCDPKQYDLERFNCCSCAERSLRQCGAKTAADDFPPQNQGIGLSNKLGNGWKKETLARLAPVGRWGLRGFGRIRRAVGRAWSGFRSSMSRAYQRARASVQRIYGRVRSWAAGALNSLRRRWASIRDKAAKAIAKLPSFLKKVINGIRSWLSSGFERLKQKAIEVARAAVERARSARRWAAGAVSGVRRQAAARMRGISRQAKAWRVDAHRRFRQGVRGSVVIGRRLVGHYQRLGMMGEIAAVRAHQKLDVIQDKGMGWAQKGYKRTADFAGDRYTGARDWSGDRYRQASGWTGDAYRTAVGSISIRWG